MSGWRTRIHVNKRKIARRFHAVRTHKRSIHICTHAGKQLSPGNTCASLREKDEGGEAVAVGGNCHPDAELQDADGCVHRQHGLQVFDSTLFQAFSLYKPDTDMPKDLMNHDWCQVDDYKNEREQRAEFSCKKSLFCRADFRHEKPREHRCNDLHQESIDYLPRKGGKLFSGAHVT